MIFEAIRNSRKSKAGKKETDSRKDSKNAEIRVQKSNVSKDSQEEHKKARVKYPTNKLSSSSEERQPKSSSVSQLPNADKISNKVPTTIPNRINSEAKSSIELDNQLPSKISNRAAVHLDHSTDPTSSYRIIGFSEVARILKENPDYLSIHTYESYVKFGPYITEAHKNSSKFWVSGMKLQNGSIYSGEIIKNKLIEGKGIVIKKDKSIFEGYFINGRMRGEGRLIDSSGTVYQGSFKGKHIVKEGTVISKGGDQVYTGELQDNLPHGNGKETWSNGSTFKGNFRKGQRHGYGEFVWSDASSYSGNFRRNRIEGIGVYTWRDGRRFEGYWKKNMMHGVGKFKWPDGKSYKGQFRRGKRQGFGIEEFENGRWYVGYWEGNEKHGHGVEFDELGSLSLGVWNNGEIKEVNKQRHALSKKQARKYKNIAVKDLKPDIEELKDEDFMSRINETLEESKREIKPVVSPRKEHDEDSDDSIQSEIVRIPSKQRYKQEPSISYSVVLYDDEIPSLHKRLNRSTRSVGIQMSIMNPEPNFMPGFSTIREFQSPMQEVTGFVKFQPISNSTARPGFQQKQHNPPAESRDPAAKFSLSEEKRIKELADILEIIKDQANLGPALEVRTSIGDFLYLEGETPQLEWSDWSYLTQDSFYKGEMKKGAIEGRGVLISSSFIYEGHWNNNQRHGLGRLILANGDVYEGSWVNDKRHGFGVSWSNSSEGYVGDWEDDIFHGKGTEINTRVVYEGDFVNGVKVGKGKFVYKDGSYYEGEVNHNAPHGYGFLVCPDGRGYVGQWKKGEMKGKGASINKDVKMIDVELFYIPQIHLQYINPLIGPEDEISHSSKRSQNHITSFGEVHKEDSKVEFEPSGHHQENSKLEQKSDVFVDDLSISSDSLLHIEEIQYFSFHVDEESQGQDTESSNVNQKGKQDERKDIKKLSKSANILSNIISL
jgi:hypothetical protein